MTKDEENEILARLDLLIGTMNAMAQTMVMLADSQRIIATRFNQMDNDKKGRILLS